MKRLVVSLVALFAINRIAVADTVPGGPVPVPVPYPTTSVPLTVAQEGSTGYQDVTTGNSGVFEVIYTNSTFTAGFTPIDPPYFYEFEIPLTGDYSVVFTDAVTGGGNVMLSDTKFFLSPTMIPLDNLNITDYPSTYPGFSPLPGANGTYPGNSPADEQVVVQDASKNGAVVPLPSSALMGLGLLASFGVVAGTRKFQTCRV